MLNKIGMVKSCQIKTSMANSTIAYSKTILQHYLCRLLTIQEIDKLYNNPKHNILQLYIIFFILIQEKSLVNNFFEQKINNEIYNFTIFYNFFEQKNK